MDRRGPRARSRASVQSWLARTRQVAQARPDAHDDAEGCPVGGFLVWLLGCGGVVAPARVRRVADVKQLIWASDAEDLRNFQRDSVCPQDAECRLFVHENTEVFMCWRSGRQCADDGLPHVNVTASRMLLEVGALEPPPVDPLACTSATREHCLRELPRDHVVLHMAVNGRLTNYYQDDLFYHWSWALLPLRPPSEIPYRMAARDLYRTASAAFRAYNFASRSCGQDLAVTLAAKYYGHGALHTRSRDGALLIDDQQWTRVQLLLLTVAVYHTFTRDWQRAANWPVVVRMENMY